MYLFAQFAYLIYTTVGSGVDFDDVRVRSVIIIRQVVDLVCQYTSNAGFAYPFRPGKEVRMADPPTFYGLFKRAGYVLLPYDFRETLRTVLAI
jgi:hypothetical protein